MAVSTNLNIKLTKAEMINKCFKEDCKTILYLFSEIENGQYKEFAQLWQDNGFSLCTVLHNNISKISNFNKECLVIAKDLFLAKDITYLRIAALYLLFTLYNRQSVRCGNRINLDINEYQLFTNIILDLYEHGYEDAKYIFLLLEEESAFDYSLCGNEQTEIEESKTNEDTVSSDSSKSDTMILNEVMVVHLKETVDTYKEGMKELNKLQNNKLFDAMQTSCETMDKNLVDITSFLTSSKSEVSSAKNAKIELVDNVSNRITIKKKAMAIKSNPKHTMSAAYPAKAIEITDSQDLLDDEKKKVPKCRIKNRRWRGSVADMIEVYDSSSDEEESDVVELNLDVLNMSDLVDNNFISSELCEVENKESSSLLEEAHAVKTEIESQDVNMSE